MESIVDVLFHSETLHPRAISAPLPSLCMSPSTQVAADQRAVGNRHHLFNRTVAPASWGLVRSVGLRAQSVRVGKLAPACFATYVESLSPRQPRSLTEVGPAELNAGAPRRYQPRHRRRQSQGMHEGPAPSRGPGPVTLSTGSPISVRGASPLRGRRRRRLAGRRARWQLRCLRQCWQACCLQCSCRPWAAPAQESAGTARQ